MEAAKDHGFRDGLVVPYHFVDAYGRMYSSLVVLFWKDTMQKLLFNLRERKPEIHLVMIYWAQRAIEIVGREFRHRAREERNPDMPETRDVLTDKERDVLAWAARGKTASETSDILKISESTVDTHFKSILRKLEAANKTHAVAKAIFLGIIDV